MKRIFKWALSIVIVFSFTYGIYTLYKHINRTTLPNKSEELKHSIQTSLNNPFSNADTVILETMWGFCGTLGPFEELPIAFDVDLENPNVIRSISRNFDQKIIPIDTFHLMFNEIIRTKYSNQYMLDIPALWNTATKSIVQMTLHAEKIDCNHIKVYETYTLGNEYKVINKDFIFKNDIWSYSIINKNN